VLHLRLQVAGQHDIELHRKSDTGAVGRAQPDHTSRNEAVLPDEVTAPLIAYMQCARWGENLLPIQGDGNPLELLQLRDGLLTSV